MSGQNQMGSGGYGDGQEMNIIYMAVGVIALVLIFGYVFYAQLVQGVFFVKFHELKFISFFVRSDDIQAVINWGNQIPYSKVKIDDLEGLFSVVGFYLKFPLTLVGLGLGIFLMIKHPDKGYDSIESMETLRAKMTPVYPAITVVQDQRVDQQPVEDGPWAMGLTPIEFAKKNKLLYRDITNAIKVDGLRAKSVFASQLGPIWTGVKNLPPHQRAIFAVLATYVSYERKTADKLLEQMAGSATFNSVKAGKINYAGIDEVLKRFGSSPAVKQILTHHAYVYTIFAELLTTARKTGIVANSLYLWIKPIDRTLWYVLNNVGRKAVFTETAAVHAHWLAERELGYAIKTPMIDPVIAGLEEAVAARIIKDI